MIPSYHRLGVGSPTVGAEYLSPAPAKVNVVGIPAGLSISPKGPGSVQVVPKLRKRELWLQAKHIEVLLLVVMSKSGSSLTYKCGLSAFVLLI